MGIKNPMDKVIKINIALSVFSLCLMLSSCMEIEHVLLTNNTSETILVKVSLLTQEGEQIMETNIAPNESDGWEFEVDKSSEKIIDEKLTSIVILNNYGCKKELQRSDILNIAEKSGAWNLVIDEKLMSCK